MRSGVPKPRVRIGDVIIGDIHPNTGFVMFEVAYADYDHKYGHWHYKDATGKLEIVQPWIEHVYKRKDLIR